MVEICMSMLGEYHSLVTRLPTRRWQCRWGGKAMSLWVSHVSLAVPVCETLPIRVVDSAGVWEEYVYCLVLSHMSLAVPVG
ncbi:unnamed protein product [Prunus armeniaca]